MSPHIKKLKEIINNERGSPLLELAIIAPFFIFLAISVYDIGRLLITHSILSQSAREGVHEAGATPFLETGTWEYDGIECYMGLRDMNDPSTWVPCIGTPRQMRILKIVYDAIGENASFLCLKPYGIRVFSIYDDVAKTVQIKVTVAYSGFWILWDGQWLHISVTGAYL